MAISTGPTTATLVVSFACPGWLWLSVMWAQRGRNQTGAPTQPWRVDTLPSRSQHCNLEVNVTMKAYDDTMIMIECAPHSNASGMLERATLDDATLVTQQHALEANVTMKAYGETMIECAHHSSAYGKMEKAALDGATLATQVHALESGAAKDEHPVNCTNLEAAVDGKVPYFEQARAASNALAEKQRIDFEILEKKATHTLTEGPGSAEDILDIGAAEYIESGTDKDSTSTYHGSNAHLWMAALGLALVCDAVLFVFTAVCCRRLLKRNSNNVEMLCDTPLDVAYTPRACQEERKLLLDEPIQDSEEEEEAETIQISWESFLRHGSVLQSGEDGHEWVSFPRHGRITVVMEEDEAATIYEVEGQVDETEMSAGSDYTHVLFPIGKEFLANDTLLIQECWMSWLRLAARRQRLARKERNKESELDD